MPEAIPLETSENRVLPSARGDSTLEHSPAPEPGLNENQYLVQETESFAEWFGADDIAVVEARGACAPSPLREFADEPYVDGLPLSTLLEGEDRAYYEQTFLPTLLETGRASWRGTEDPPGFVHDGSVMTLTEHGYTLAFGERIRAADSQTHETCPPFPDHETYAHPPAPSVEPRMITLDAVL